MPRRGGSKSGPNKAIQAKIQAKFGKASSQTGGRGSVRRKFKAPPKSSLQDDKRLQGQLKKLNVNPIPAIEEVNLFKDDNTVVHFTKPKVQAEIASNTYVISGQCETKKLEELIPQILPQLGREHIDSLKDFAKTYAGVTEDDDDDVPVLVDDNFEAVASSDVKTDNEKNDGDDNDTTDATDANGDAAPTDDAGGADKNDDKQEDATANNDDNTADDDVPDLVPTGDAPADATDAAPADAGADADAAKDKEALKPDAEQEASV